MNCPQIVESYGAFESEFQFTEDNSPTKVFIIILQNVRGMTLLQYVKEKSRRGCDFFEDAEFNERLLIIYDIILAIKACYNERICHNDITLDNLMYISGTRTQLIDFGVAQQCETNESLINCRSGKPGYLPPEFDKGDNYSGFKRDIYDLGVVTYILFTGKTLVSDEVKIQRKLLSKSFKDYCLIYNKNALKWPKELFDFVSSCLTPDPSQRPLATDLLTNPLFKTLRRSYKNRMKNWTYKIESKIGIRRSRSSSSLPSTPMSPKLGTESNKE